MKIIWGIKSSIILGQSQSIIFSHQCLRRCLKLINLSAVLNQTRSCEILIEKWEGKFWGTTGGLGKNEGLKRMTMSRWITYMPTLLPRSKVQKVQSTYSDGKGRDVRRHMGNNRVGTQWDHFHMAIYTCFHSFILWWLPLTRISVSLYKISCL